MGRKRTRKRQYLCCFAALLIIMIMTSCASIKTVLDERASETYLHEMQTLMNERDYTTVYWENQRILTYNPTISPADAALFSQGLAYVDPANPKQDQQLAKEQFRQLLYAFPYSRYSGEAAVWMRMLDDEQWKVKEKQQFLQDMQKLINKGDFALAEKQCLDLLEQSPDDPLKDAALLGLGRIYADPGNPKQDYQAAMDYFSKLVANFPYSPFADEAGLLGNFLKTELNNLKRSKHLKKVQLFINRNDFESALRENRNQIATDPKQVPTDVALFSNGLIYLKVDSPKKDFSQAKMLFSRVVHEFPGSSFAEESKIILNLLELLGQTMQIDREIDEKTKVLR